MRHWSIIISTISLGDGNSPKLRCNNLLTSRAFSDSIKRANMFGQIDFLSFNLGQVNQSSFFFWLDVPKKFFLSFEFKNNLILKVLISSSYSLTNFILHKYHYIFNLPNFKNLCHYFLSLYYLLLATCSSIFLCPDYFWLKKRSEKREKENVVFTVSIFKTTSNVIANWYRKLPLRFQLFC